MENNNQGSMLTADQWLRGEYIYMYDIEGAAQAITQLSNSVMDDTKEGREIVANYEEGARNKRLSFSNMTKAQQLNVIARTGRNGPHYNAFISNAARHVLSLARKGYEDIEPICDGFEQEDLKRISTILKMFAGEQCRDFIEKFDRVSMENISGMDGM